MKCPYENSFHAIADIFMAGYERLLAAREAVRRALANKEAAR